MVSQPKPHGGWEGAAGHAGTAQLVPAAEPRRQPKPSASRGQGNSKDLRHELTFQKSCASAWFFSLGGSKLQFCHYFQSCANVSPGFLAPCGFFSLLTRDTNWNHLFLAAPCAEKTSFPTAPWCPRPPSHPHTPKIVAAAGTEQRRYLKREKLDLVL